MLDLAERRLDPGPVGHVNRHCDRAIAGHSGFPGAILVQIGDGVTRALFASALARPTPVAPPVMTARRPFRSPSSGMIPALFSQSAHSVGIARFRVHIPNTLGTEVVLERVPRSLALVRF